MDDIIITVDVDPVDIVITVSTGEGDFMLTDGTNSDIDYLDFDLTPATAVNAPGRLWWNEAAKTLSLGLLDGGSYEFGNSTAASVSSVPTDNILSTNSQSDKAEIDYKLLGYRDLESAAGTETLSVTSAKTQSMYGTNTHSYQMPVVSTLTLGREFEFLNRSTGLMTIYASNGTSVITTVAAGLSVRLKCISLSGTDETSWRTISCNSIDEMTITTFTDSILLDKLLGRDYGSFNVTSPLKVLLDETGIKDGSYAQLAAIGDGNNNLDLSNFNKSDENGLDYLSTNDYCNAIIFYRYMKKNYYTIIDQYLCSAPTLLSAYTSSNGAIVCLQFSRTMANPSEQSALFTLSPSKNISSISLKSDDKTIIQLNLASNYTAANTILITIASGLMPEGIGDGYIGVTDQLVTNNVAPNISWTSLVNETLAGNTATCNSATGSAQGGTLSKTHGNYVQMVIITPKADSYGSVLILDDDNTDNDWVKPYGSHCVFNQSAGTYVVEGSTVTNVATSSVENTILRLELSLESGTWYVLTKRSTNGIDWTEIRKTALSITGTIYIKHIIATTGSKVYNATMNNV